MHWTVMAQTAIGVILVVAAIAKAIGKVSIGSFLEAMSVPPAVAGLVGVLLPVAEGLLGMLLVLRIGGGAVLRAVAVVSIGFALTLVVAQLRGVTTGCRCFGVLDSERLTPVAVARAVILAVAASALVAWGNDQAPVGPATTSAAWLGVLAAAAYVASFAMLSQVYEFERGRNAVLTRLKARQSVATAEELGR